MLDTFLKSILPELIKEIPALAETLQHLVNPEGEKSLEVQLEVARLLDADVGRMKQVVDKVRAKKKK